VTALFTRSNIFNVQSRVLSSINSRTYIFYFLAIGSDYQKLSTSKIHIFLLKTKRVKIFIKNASSTCLAGSFMENKLKEKIENSAVVREFKGIGRDLSDFAGRVNKENAKIAAVKAEGAIKAIKRNAVAAIQKSRTDLAKGEEKTASNAAKLADKLNKYREKDYRKSVIETAKFAKWVLYDGAPVGKAIAITGLVTFSTGLSVFENAALTVGGFVVYLMGLEEATREAKRHRQSKITRA
jgi:hypothetical protein